jgi:hypothetical protein
MDHADTTILMITSNRLVVQKHSPFFKMHQTGMILVIAGYFGVSILSSRKLFVFVIFDVPDDYSRTRHHGGKRFTFP